MRICTQSSALASRAGAERITSLSPAGIVCPRTDTHLTYMIDIALTTEFAITVGGAR
jgi:hypothetical protein